MNWNRWIHGGVVIALSACSSQQRQAVDVLITNATILDIQQGVTVPSQLVAIRSDTIVAVEATENYQQYQAKRSIDAKGYFTMPGLWDNHVHFRGGDSLILENKNLLPLFLIHGITTVRDAGGDITPAILQWKAEIQKGQLVGPEIFSSGPKLDGEKPAWPGSISVLTAGDVSHALDSLEALQVDYVKMYDGSLTQEMYYEIIRQAERRGLKTTGHMPLSANITEGVEYGLDGAEHLYYILKACSPFADSLTSLNLGYGMLGTLIETYDSTLADSVFEKLGKGAFYVTPTLQIGKTLAEVLDVDHTQDKVLPFIGPGIQQTYRRRIETAKRVRASGVDTRSRLEIAFKRMIRPMHEAGIKLLAGSDCGAYNSFVYPGESLHGELERLVDAGLTPREALLTSIQNGPEFFDKGAYYGSLSAGKVANLILLKQNPLDDIVNIRSVETVILGDKVYDQEALHTLLTPIHPVK